MIQVAGRSVPDWWENFVYHGVYCLNVIESTTGFPFLPLPGVKGQRAVVRPKAEEQRDQQLDRRGQHFCSSRIDGISYFDITYVNTCLKN